MNKYLLGIGAAALGLSGCVSSGGLFASHNPQSLEPYGVKASGPAVVHMVLASHSPVHDGDTILTVSGKPVTAYSFYSVFTPRGQMKVKTEAGKVHMVSDASLLAKRGAGLKAGTLNPGGTFIFRQKVPAYQRVQDAGLVVMGHERGLISASLWHTKPRILELYVDLRSDASCRTCNLKNLAAMDWSRKAWLTPVPANKVAWVVYPPDNSAGPLMNVPPPTPVGYTSTSNTTGTFNGNVYGNSYSGNYSGYTTTTTSPYYDYTATDMAEAYNLATIFQQAHIRQDDKNRRTFAVDRIGNLRLGRMQAGERMTGYVDFVVPNDFNGPFVVAIKGNGKFAAVKFDLTHG